MIYLAAMFGFLGGWLHTNPHPSFKEEEILDESLTSINRYVVPEIDKVLPKKVCGVGYNNMIGFERLKISIYCPTADLQQIEHDTMKAYQAAQKGFTIKQIMDAQVPT